MKKVLTVIAAIIILLCCSANAQIYKFRQYGIREGLCHQFVYSIEQDKNGFIWFATGMGLCRYDGINFSMPDGDLPTANINVSFKDDAGNLWFGYNNGLTVKYDGASFSIADTSVTKTAVTQIIQTPEGDILVATQTGGITRISDKKTDRIDESFNSIMISALCFAGNDKLLVGAFDGLYLFNYGEQTELLTSSEELSYRTVAAITPKMDGSGYWVATSEDGIYFVAVDENSLITKYLDIPELYYAQVQSVYEDAQNNLWISTFGQGLLRIQLSPEMNILGTSAFNSSNGMGSDNVKQAFFDNRQNLWIATFGQGVAGINNLAFSFFDDLNAIDNNASAVFSYDDSEYWIAGAGVIIKITTKPEPAKIIYGRANGLPYDKITALRTDNDGNLWIGAENSGLYILPKNSRNISLFYREENSLSNCIQNFIFADEQIWMATRNGVIVIDPQTKQKVKHHTTFDGGLPHNNIRDIFKDSKNRVWIATNSNSLVEIKNNNRLFLQNEYDAAIFLAIAEDEQGRIWAGTEGKGIYIFDERRDTVYHLTSDNGLSSDFCYAMTFDGNRQIWAGHRLGLSSIDTERFIINTLGINNGIHGDVNPLAMILNNSGEMLIGMTDGVMKYEVKIDKKDELPPIINLTRIFINEVPYNVHASMPIVLRHNRYKLQFEFTGLQFSDPNSVSYQYFLQNYDSDWSSISKNGTAIYPRIENGNYSFWVKACNNSSCSEVMLFSIKIRKPFWKTWWFIILLFVVAAWLVYAIISVRERNHIMMQQYLENELMARTKEVHKQKEEIEIKNKDITDSINYAQRIQFSVLPTTATLQKHCSGAFIFYRPRDIVSGDFYWFDFFPETKNMLIVCADSTGHGVPGAFMSLIGTTLIKDITLRPDIKTPADILYRLDENIHSTLNQNRDSEQANDGMDIIVCEINTETYLTRIASAMRPYIIYRDGKPTVYKGNRLSIGGQFRDKIFETNEIQLSKGDMIYMFTDGYADQFGGQSGKKMKFNRLLNILNDINNRHVDEQHRVIRENFDLWKGANEQVDDVLLIGIRV